MAIRHRRELASQHVPGQPPLLEPGSFCASKRCAYLFGRYCQKAEQLRAVRSRRSVQPTRNSFLWRRYNRIVHGQRDRHVALPAVNPQSLSVMRGRWRVTATQTNAPPCWTKVMRAERAVRSRIPRESREMPLAAQARRRSMTRAVSNTSTADTATKSAIAPN